MVGHEYLTVVIPLCMYLHVHARVYVCMYVCMYVCVVHYIKLSCVMLKFASTT